MFFIFLSHGVLRSCEGERERRAYLAPPSFVLIVLYTVVHTFVSGHMFLAPGKFFFFFDHTGMFVFLSHHRCVLHIVLFFSLRGAAVVFFFCG